MTRHSRPFLALIGLLVILFAAPVWGAIDVQSDGTDGALDLPTSPGVCVGGVIVSNVCTIDLAQAVTATWNTAGTGVGVYDAAKWAIVLKYSSVNIDAGTTVEFLNHPSRAPVVWLVDTNATINGVVDLNGSNDTGTLSQFSEPGPGGFRGGRAPAPNNNASAGLGPGGGNAISNSGCGGSYGFVGGSSGCGIIGPTYGSDRVLPLIGGSGGGGDGNSSVYGGGAGGGAILIAADETITLGGTIQANGGNGAGTGGSGGGIRLIADSVTDPNFPSGPNGLLRAFQGAGANNNGGAGRIRVEANSITLSDPSGPQRTTGEPCIGAGCTCAPITCTGMAEIWPDPSTNPPSVQITNVAGVTAPADPRSDFNFPNQDVRMADNNPVTVTIQAQNVPIDGSWDVKVRVVPKGGLILGLSEYCAGSPVGDVSSSTWTASVPFPNADSAAQVRASVGTSCP